MTTTPPSPSSASASALTAFVHGIEARAWVLALSQCGDPKRATVALQAALHAFVVRAQQLPLAQWPLQFWSGLLQQPAMLAQPRPGLPLAQLACGPRAALLLRLIAGLDISHAAQALGVSLASYEAALAKALADPGLDAAAIQALREELHRQIQQLPEWRRQALTALRESELQALPAPAGSPPRGRRWRPPSRLEAALALLLLALAATFFWPVKSMIAPGQSEALPVEPVAAPPTLTDTVIVTHPDYAQLADPEQARIAEQLPFLSWLAAATVPTSSAEPAPDTESQTQAFAALPSAEQALLVSAEAAWPTLDQATRTALLGNVRHWQTLSPAQRSALRDRLREWDGQPALERGRKRTPFAAWQNLSAGDRQRVRLAAAGLTTRPAPDAEALHAQFGALPVDTQRLWSMGPALGQELVPISSLFAFVPEAERPALLQVLRTLEPSARADLALLAPRLSEARRQALRRDLLATSPAQRAQLIRQRLAQ